MPNGIRTLSFTGKGKLSIIMATAAPINANAGDTKNVPAKKAKKNPTSEPSSVFPLLNGNGFFAIPPKSEAVLSPKANMAMAAPFSGAGKITKVIIMPMAKYSGVVANSYSSAGDAALRVTSDITGRFFLLIRNNSDMKKSTLTKQIINATG